LNDREPAFLFGEYNGVFLAGGGRDDLIGRGVAAPAREF
jgi:hypothetical protein